MDWDAERIQARLDGVNPVSSPGKTGQSSRIATTEEGFKTALDKALKTKEALNVTVSAHASERLMDRGITLDQADLQKISDGLDKASEKGARESLFILRDIALVMSVENRTVITALHGDAARDNVFTQIDSAVLL